MTNQIILITGASSGFGRLTAEALAAAGHTVYASMRGTNGSTAATVADVEQNARTHGVDIRAIELDVQSEARPRRPPRTSSPSMAGSTC